MTFDDNACIRYLMKEMDPSEELLFEKKMMEDENLLIEVESLRKVNQRLSDVPCIKPPAHLTRQILKDASDHYSNRQRKESRTIYLTAAATIMVIFFAGAFFIYDESNTPSDSSQTGQANMGATSGPVLDLKLESASNGVSPWVDNNEELHFEDRFNTDRAAAFDSILNNSFQRLQPLNEREQRNDRIRDLHLTGTRGSN